MEGGRKSGLDGGDWAGTEARGARISYDDEYHSIFVFRKCTVENHVSVLNVSPYKVTIRINDLLEEHAKDSTDEAALGLVLPSAIYRMSH